MSGTRATPRIIVFNMNFIGDVLFTTPALAALRKGYPEAEVTVVVGRRAKDVLVANPDVDHLVEFPRTLSERWQLLRRFFRRFDLSLSLSSRNVERAAWGMALGCRQRWGFNRPETRLFLTGRIEERRDRHWAEDYLELACLAGGKRDGDLPRFYLTPEEKAWAEELPARWGLRPGHLWIGVHVGASYPEKAWRPERFLELARLADEASGAQVIAFGGPGEEAATGDWLATQATNAVNLAGKLSLRDFAAAVSRCTAFVGGDSGPTHIAAALGVPTVGLYGFTDPTRMGPLGERVEVLLGLERHWDPNAQRLQESPYQWLDPISPEEVWKAIGRLTAR